MTERDRRAPERPGDDAAEAAPGGEPAPPETVDTADVAVAGDPVETDPDLAEPADGATDATDAAADLTRVGPGQGATSTTTTGSSGTVAATPPRRSVDRRAGRMPPQPAVPTPSDQAVHIDDRVSKIFVIATVAAFVLILLNGLLFGHGGALAPTPTPTPVPSVSVSASPSSSAAPSGSAAPGASPAASGSPASSASPASASPS